MRDFHKFLEEKIQQDEGLGKFITQMGTRALNAVTGGGKQPWEIPGAIPGPMQAGWKALVTNLGNPEAAWAKFQELMQTPVGRYQLQRAAANMNAQNTNANDRRGNYGNGSFARGGTPYWEPRGATKSPYE